ncbi:M23 family metallopeptidase [Brachybacterium sp. P6-10-X1]|uniref:M23 family metallopeptidase n=1 Tax=Brachybacterium sp. P6-10-X1 TaxID=1903186 RepID=UPI0020A2542E|nr:M23 family metallopeptidase [Brachybacterium sp. P6-10-X1]
MANHRADGRATVRTLRANPGSHRHGALPASAVKVGVLGALATATIAAPLAAAAAGIDEAAAPGDVTAAQAPQSDAAAQSAELSAAPVALPEAGASASVTQAAETRETDEGATRSEERTSSSGEKDAAEDEKAAAEEEKAAEDLAMEVEVPEPEPADSTQSASGDSTPASSGGYIKPVNAPITSGFGGRVHPVLGYFKGHNGVDFGASCGTPVKAAKGGTVVAVENTSASGNRVKIDHGNGVITGYYHLQGFNTSVGATVAQGDTIGYVGSTGRSTGCHLHFAKMDEGGNYSNPMSILR